MCCQMARHLKRLLLMSVFFALGYAGMHSLGYTYAGTLEGTVHYVGSVPTPKVVKVVKDQDHCGAEVRIQTIHIHDAQGALSDAVVSVEGVKKKIRLLEDRLNVRS